jgi:hypothetical protein
MRIFVSNFWYSVGVHMFEAVIHIEAKYINFTIFRSRNNFDILFSVYITSGPKKAIFSADLVILMVLRSRSMLK